MDTKTLEALSDENRLAIVRLLAGKGELCVCDISEALGISNALASHHLKKLREAGLVTTARRGTWLHCTLDARALRTLADGLTELAAAADAVPPGACCCSGPAKSLAKEETADV